MIVYDQVRPARTDIPLDVPELHPECLDCGHMFHVDSSPNLILCWQCDEAAEVTS